jgi:hypothetical protein
VKSGKAKWRSHEIMVEPVIYKPPNMSKVDEIYKKVIADLSPKELKKKDEVRLAWYMFLTKHLKFPFEAKVNLFSFSQNLKNGDEVKVLGINDMVDMYGVLMDVKFSRYKYQFPLVELIPTEIDSENFIIIEAYQTYFDD